MFVRNVALALLSLNARLIQGRPKDHDCPHLHRGTFNVEQYQLYPENAEWDPESCLVYFGYVQQ